MFASVTISVKAAKKLESGCPWVFDRDLLSRRFDIAGIVGVQDKRGRFLGQAFYSPRSKIALRFIVKTKDKLDKEFWRKRVLNAFYRMSRQKASDAFRVVYAESDGVPSVILDKYNDVFALQISSAGAEAIKNDLIAIIVDEFKPVAVIEKDNIEARKLEGLPLIEKCVYGSKTTTIIHEGGQKFEVDVLHGQKTGAYLDYRAFRLKASELILNPPSPPLQKGDKGGFSALDLFCYQGWLTCHVAGGAKKVIAVDASKSAMETAKRNAEMNGHKNIEFVCADVFDFLVSCKEKFDFIHLDPPPFAKGRLALPTAIKGYKKLNSAALKLLSPGGILFASSCSHHISENMLEGIVCDPLIKSGAKFNIIYRGIQDSDHPLLKNFPESLYLKAIAVKI